MYKKIVIKFMHASIILWLTSVVSIATAARAVVVLQGTVESACSITNLQGGQRAFLRDGGTTEVTFTYSCNTPFYYTLESLHGGLKLSSGTEVSEYSVTTTLPTNSATSISDTCSSADIKVGSVTCNFTDSGTAIASDKQGILDVSWEQDDDLPTGAYEDSLTITIEAQN